MFVSKNDLLEKRLTVLFLLQSSVETTPHKISFPRFWQSGNGKASLVFFNQARRLCFKLHPLMRF
jgi:hypothetical protein